MRSKRLSVVERRLATPVFAEVLDTFSRLLNTYGFTSKLEVMREANTLGIKDTFDWLALVNALRAHQPLILILPLTQLIFFGPRAKARQGVTPSRYICPTIKHAFGYASVAQFAQLGELHRQICEAKYHREQIAAASHVRRVGEFADAIVRLDAPQPALPLLVAP